MPDRRLLQAFEQTLEGVGRLSQVVRLLIDKMQAGERLSDRDLSYYLEQLSIVEREREGTEKMIATLWRVGSDERAH